MKQLLALILLSFAAFPAHSQPRALKVQPIEDVLPPDARVGEVVTANFQQRFYYEFPVDRVTEVWMYDRITKASKRIVQGDLWDVVIAPNGSGLAYTKTGERSPGDEFVWILPLDPRTGLAAGPERRVSTIQGDVPSFSPDGKWLAFARDDSLGGQSLAVVPFAGGPARILATLNGVGINSIRWTADSKSLFYGANAPRERSGESGSIYRVPLSGGASRTIVRAGALDPMLSPDGKLLVYGDTASPRTLVVADTSGRRLATFVLPTGTYVTGWAGNTSLLTTTGGYYRRIRTFSLTDGASRVVVDSLHNASFPRWSSDGKRISLLENVGLQTELLILNADGSNRKSVSLREQAMTGNVWSPDNKWIALRGQGNRSRSVTAVDVANGRALQLSHPLFPGPSYLAWSADSKHVRYLDADPGSHDAGGTRRVPLHDVDVAGKLSVLKELTFNGTRVWLSTVADSMVIIKRDAGEAVTIAPLRETGPEKQLVPPRSGFVSIPWLSPDQQWVAFRRNPTEDNGKRFTLLDVMLVDGTRRKTISLPFNASEGDMNPQFLPGNQQLIVGESLTGDAEASLYLVTVATGNSTKILTIPRWRNRPMDWALSPDGKSVLYVSPEHVPVKVGTVDLAPLISSPSRP